MHIHTQVIQLYETFNVRFGVMLVGPAGGGKTRCYQTLKAAMTQLRKDGNPDPNYQVWRAQILGLPNLNPNMPTFTITHVLTDTHIHTCEHAHVHPNAHR